MARTFLGPLTIALLVGSGAAAQQPGQTSPTPPPQAKPAPPTEQPATRPEPAGQPLNIRVEFTITEEVGGAAPAKKLVTLTVADRQNSYVRSGGDVRVGERYRNVNINVDARPTILREGLVRLDVTLEYRPQATGGATGEPALWGISERVGVILDSGKPLIISQAFDPTSDRRMTVELKATILK
jgi:hypothetical protein